MKTKIIIIVFSAILFCLTSCDSCSKKTQQTHNHENCSGHDHGTKSQSDCTDSSKQATEQESFKVEADKADTTKVNQPDSHTHSGCCAH